MLQDRFSCLIPRILINNNHQTVELSRNWQRYETRGVTWRFTSSMHVLVPCAVVLQENRGVENFLSLQKYIYSMSCHCTIQPHSRLFRSNAQPLKIVYLYSTQNKVTNVTVENF